MMFKYDTLGKEPGMMIGFKSSKKLLDTKKRRWDFHGKLIAFERRLLLILNTSLLCRSHGKSLINVIMKGGGGFLLISIT